MTQDPSRRRATGEPREAILIVMVYPKQIEWNGKSSAHPERTRRSQRELVAASLLRLPAERVRWDEATRSEYLVTAR